MQNEDDDGEFVERSDEKTWVRHHRTGDLGWLVKKDGRTYVRMDRAFTNLRDYRRGEWDIEQHKRPLTRYQLASIALEADQLLCKSIGLVIRTKPWLMMSPAERQAWRDKGPTPKEPESIRQCLWDSIMGGMKRFVE